MTGPLEDRSLSRRDCLQVLGLGMLTGSTGCLRISSDPKPATELDSENLNDPDTATLLDTGDTGLEPIEECLSATMQLQLDQYPELSMVGGSSTVSFPDDYVHILVVCVGVNDWIAVWKICTHGTCDVEWAADLGLVRCPCHNSLFDWDGTVLQGPAERDLAAFTVCLDDDGRTLNIQRR